MNVLIVGCGKVGSSLTAQLCNEGYEVSVLDIDAECVNDISNSYDVLGIAGDGTSIESLKDANVEQADLLCAVTDSDEKNLLCCVIARQLSSCRLVARVRKPVYNHEMEFFRDKFDLAMVINPEMASAQEMTRIFRFPSAINIDTFAKGSMDLMSFRVKEGCPICGLSLSEIRNRFKYDVLICVAVRGDKVVIPSGDFVVEAGDVLSLVASQKNAAGFFEYIGITTNPVKSVMIVGGGMISYYLARNLISNGLHVKIVDNDRKRCEELEESLPKAEIIFGDGTDEVLLREEGIGRVQGFAALTGIDEENVLLSLYAQSETAVNAKIITKINKITYDKVIDKMNLDSIINPKELTAEYILQYIRSMDATSSSIQNLYRLADGKVEAIEFQIHEDEKGVTNVKLQDMKIRDNILIGKILRHGQPITPSGQDELHVGDTVIVISMAKDKMSRLADIIKR